MAADWPTRFDRLGRGPATILLALFAALLLLAAWPGAAPRQELRQSQAEQSDLDLYRSTIERLRSGEAYYPVVADELRKGGYPLRPFVTFRLPTLAMLYASVPPVGMALGEGLLALGVLIIWWRRLTLILPLPLLALGLVLMVGGTFVLVGPITGLFHESWAGLLLALMVGLRRPGHAAGAIVAGAAALLVRETALPMILVMAAGALLDGRRREALAWAALIAVFALVIVAHAAMVASVVTPADPSSPGWDAMLGLRFALGAIATSSAAALLPAPVAAILLLLSILGWCSVSTGWALRASLLLIGYGAMLALFARADTFYWGLLAAPLSLVGLVFVPRAIAALVRAARGVAQPAS